MRISLTRRLVAPKFVWSQRRGFKRMEKVKKSLPSLGVLDVSPNELLLDATLPCGQSFRWKKQPDNSWFGVLGRHFVALEQHGNENKIYFASTNPSPQDMHEKLHDYFQLKVVLQDCYRQWSQIHSEDEKKKFESINSAFGEAAERLPGIRLLRQDPHECFFSFICSQNNNIKRISQMIDKLTIAYGDHVFTVDDEKYHAFPTLDQMAKLSEDELRDLGFGYRAKYIVKAVEQVQERGGEKWLHSLRAEPRAQVQEKLTELMGVGRKVADCVALFSLDKLDLVPVDTHVWQIAQRYMKSLAKAAKSTNVTPVIYNEIGDFFRSRFGPLAGWAHTVLFAAELHDFKKVMSGEASLTSSKQLAHDAAAIEEKFVDSKLAEIVKSEPQEKKKVKQEKMPSKKRKRPDSDDEFDADADGKAAIKLEDAPLDAGAFMSAADRVKSRKRTKTT